MEAYYIFDDETTRKIKSDNDIESAKLEIEGFINSSEFDGLVDGCGCGCHKGNLLSFCDNVEDAMNCSFAFMFDCSSCERSTNCLKQITENCEQGDCIDYIMSIDKLHCEPRFKDVVS